MDASLSVTPTVLSSGDLNIQAILPHDFQREIQPCAPVGSPKQKSILLLDCRPFLLFNDQHILMAKNSMIPSIVKRRSRGCVPLSTLVPCEEKRARLLSGAFHLIVVYDQDSDDLATDPKQSNLGIVLRSLLFHVSSDKLRFLKGGYSRFNELFPELCVSQNSLCDNLENTMRISKDESYAKQIQESGPAEVLSYLYLGDSRHAAKKDLLKELGITAIVNVSKHCNNHFPEDFVYKQIPVDDKTDTELAPWFNDAIGFIDSQKTRGGKVLVHCQAGVSRSATICVAYIMFKRKCPMDEAFDRVQKQRAVISPNLSFMRQLRNFERKLEIESPASPRRPMLSPCRLSSNTPGFWCSAGQAADESYRWALTAGSMVSPLLSPTTPFLSSPILSPI